VTAAAAMPDEIMLDLAHIKELTDTLGADTLREMVPSFLESVGTYRDTIETAAKAGKLKEAQRAAHALKGLCAQFGAPSLSRLAASIETGTTSTDTIIEKIPKLSALAVTTSDAVRAHFRT
jgi:HPt (histidine-containing phosphotransfer) domain-containing protein